MKKKIISLSLALCLTATAIVGGTLAYFTDSDLDQNVMTSGNVKIVQNETNRDGKAWSEDNTAHLVPAVYLDADGNPYNPTTSWEGPVGGVNASYFVGPDGATITLYTDSLNNEIDKIVSVTNKGTEAAYIRTIVLFENYKGENGELTDKLHAAYNAGMDSGITMEWINEITVNGQLYEAYVFTYDEALAAGTTSKASLKQIWLDPNTGSDWYDMLGDGKLEILALSQAAQVTGFDNAAEALNTAFGKVTDANVADWLAKTTIETAGLSNVVAD